MRPSLRLIAALGVGVFLVAAIAGFPARVAVQWLAPDSVEISGIRGTVWNGEAATLAGAGLYLTRVRWSLSPLSLLSGSPTVDLEASPANGFIEGRISAGRKGDVRIENLTAAIPLAMLADAARTPGLSGTASLRFDYLVLDNGFPVSANGSIDIDRMRVPPVSSASLGGYRLEFNDLDGGVIASIEDIDNVIDVAGTLTLGPARSYSLLAQLAATRSTPEALSERIGYLPSGNAPGMKEIRLEGSL